MEIVMNIQVARYVLPAFSGDTRVKTSSVEYDYLV
jgi:hypothetical protein